MPNKSYIDSVEVKMPCDAEWDEMTGNDMVRFCGHCATSVNNISSLRRKDAMRLVRASNGRLCIRFIGDPVSHRPMFAEQLVQIARRTPSLAAGVLGASISLATLAMGQSRPQQDERASDIVETRVVTNGAQPEQNSNDDEKAETGGGVIRGVIRDRSGSPVPGVLVYLASESFSAGESTVTDEDGRYEFADLEAETYMLRVQTSSGFVRKVAPGVTLSGSETITQDINVRTHVIHVSGFGTGTSSGFGEGFGGASFAISYRTPLFDAVSDNDIERVRKLLMSGEKVNIKDDGYNDITPLFIAVENGNVEIARLLIQYGAKVNARDASKRTPLMFVDDDATPELIGLLISSGAKINANDLAGETPLSAASESGNAPVVDAMIKAGAELDRANDDGKTPLMKAVEAERTAVIEVLITAGADISLKDKNGDTAWDITSDREIERMLIDAGAVANYDVEVEVTVFDGEVEPVIDEPKPAVSARPK